MRRHRPPRRGQVGHGQYEPHLTSQSLCHGHSLQLRGAELRLEIAEAALNLDEDHSRRAVQDHVRSPAIRRPRDRHFEANTPGVVRFGPDPVCQGQLPRVA